jgi:cytochrome c2
MRNKLIGKAKFSNLRPKLLLLLIFSLGCLVMVVSACGSETSTPVPTPAPVPAPAPTPPPAPPTTPTPDTAEEGKALFISKACVGCHTVQEIPEAQGKVGPELTRQASNSLIAGVLPNTDENLRKWLKDPAAVKPETIMPNQGLTDSEVDALVAFLRTLK